MFFTNFGREKEMEAQGWEVFIQSESADPSFVDGEFPNGKYVWVGYVTGEEGYVDIMGCEQSI